MFLFKILVDVVLGTFWELTMSSSLERNDSKLGKFSGALKMLKDSAEIIYLHIQRFGFGLFDLCLH